MIDANIAQALAPVQHLNNIYCPMCEDWHANNSWCQAPADCFETMEGHS